MTAPEPLVPEPLAPTPLLELRDVDHVTQWAMCSGAGGGLPVALPDVATKVARNRLEAAAPLGADVLASACVWAEDHLERVAAADVVVAMKPGLDTPQMKGTRHETWSLPDPTGWDIDSVRTLRDDVARQVSKLARSLETSSSIPAP